MLELNEDQKGKVNSILMDKLCVDQHEIKDESNLRDDLGADSLDEVELMMEFGKEFDIAIPDSIAENLTTVKDVYEQIAIILNA